MQVRNQHRRLIKTTNLPVQETERSSPIHVKFKAIFAAWHEVYTLHFFYRFISC